MGSEGRFLEASKVLVLMISDGCTISTAKSSPLRGGAGRSEEMGRGVVESDLAARLNRLATIV